MTVADFSLTSCMRAHSQLGFHSLGSGVVSPLQLHWVMGVCVFGCNLPPALLAGWQGLLCATAVTQGWNRHQIRVGAQSGEEESPATPAGIWTCSLFIMSPVIYQQAVPGSWHGNRLTMHNRTRLIKTTIVATPGERGRSLVLAWTLGVHSVIDKELKKKLTWSNIWFCCWLTWNMWVYFM